MDTLRRFASIKFWRYYWWWWLLAVLVSWLVPELVGLAIGYGTHQAVPQDFTLSDTIRRWAAGESWLAPVVVGVTAMLVWHFFVEKNPGERSS